MSLILSESKRIPGSVRAGTPVEIKSQAPFGSPNYLGKGGSEIRVGDCWLSMEDFCHAVVYVMTNTDLEDEDPRRELARVIGNIREIPGHNSGATRFETSND